MYKIILSLLVVFTTSGCVSNLADTSTNGFTTKREADGSAPVKKGAGLLGLSKAKDIDQSTGRFIKGQTQIGVPFFNIVYLKSDKFKSKSASANVNAKLGGVSDDILQSITDSAYTDLNNKLKNADFSVIPLATLKNAKSYKKLSNNLKRNEKEFSTVAIGTKDGKKGSFSSSVMSLSKENDKLPMLDVNYTVHFAYAQTGGGFTFSRRDTAAKAVINIEGGATIAGSAGGTVLQGDFKFGQNPYSKKDPGTFSNETANTTVALDMAKRWMLGGRQVNTDMHLASSDSVYKQAALEALYNANTQLVAHLKSKR